MISPKVKDILRCTNCSSSLDEGVCSSCGEKYLVDNGGRLIFKSVEFREGRFTSKVKNYLRNNFKVDELVYFLFSPVLINTPRSKMLLKRMSREDIVVNVGGGSSKLPRGVINVDIKPFHNVDIVADCMNLPFKDNSVDGIISEVVLEHVRDPQKAVKEMFRVLKPGGYIYVDIPFMQGYHESPGDYQRYTVEGLEVLFGDFKRVRIGVSIGPSSTVAWILKDYLAILFSFNSRKVYNFLSLALIPLTWPIKLLDLVLVHNKNAHNIASLLYFFGRK